MLIYNYISLSQCQHDTWISLSMYKIIIEKGVNLIHIGKLKPFKSHLSSIYTYALEYNCTLIHGSFGYGE